MTDDQAHKPWRSALTAPTLADIRLARETAGLSQAQAAELAGVGGQTRWAEYENGTRRPAAPAWELWLLRVHLHPEFKLIPRRGFKPSERSEDAGGTDAPASTGMTRLGPRRAP